MAPERFALFFDVRAASQLRDRQHELVDAVTGLADPLIRAAESAIGLSPAFVGLAPTQFGLFPHRRNFRLLSPPQPPISPRNPFGSAQSNRGDVLQPIHALINRHAITVSHKSTARDSTRKT